VSCGLWPIQGRVKFRAGIKRSLFYSSWIGRKLDVKSEIDKPEGDGEHDVAVVRDDPRTKHALFVPVVCPNWATAIFTLWPTRVPIVRQTLS
jgi:hypothetical protein